MPKNNLPTKISVPNKFKPFIEKNIFFVLSTGRSGTQTIAQSLSGLRDCICLHEPAPPLILESSAYRYGRLDGEKLKQLILQTRRPMINGKIYGESNQISSLIVPVITASFPKAKFIWMIRNGLEVVASIFSRQWYTGHSANHERYEDCPPIEKAWIDGRIMGDLCGDVPFAKWKSMDSFARCCWYWSYVNRTIEKDLKDYCSIGRYRKIKLEEIEKELPQIIEWLGLDPVPDLKCGRHNSAHYKLYRWQKWTLEERKTFLYWCGPLMDRLYPAWRTLNREFFAALNDSPKNIMAPIECHLGKNKKNLHDSNSSNARFERADLYYTPRLRTHAKISVYITSYNQKEYLVEAIESVLSQTLSPHQIIIVDDFSNDGSQELIAKYAQKYPNLIFPIYHRKNFGVVRTRIDALKAVTGDYVTYVDGDDRFLPEKLEREFNVLSGNSKAQIAYSNNYYINPAGQRIGIWADETKPPQGYVFKETFARRFPKNNLFRMEIVDYQALKSVGFHDPDITIYEDFDLRIRLTKHFQVAFCDAPLSEIRLHDNGLSKLKAKQHLESLEFIYHKNKDLLVDLNEYDRKIAKKGFNDFVAKISLNAARQLNADRELEKRELDKNSRAVENKESETKQQNKLNRLGANLIFLISQPRAGSTLFQRLLAGHPEIHATAEPWIMLHPVYALKAEGIDAEYRSLLAMQGLEDFLMQVPEGIELYKKALRKFGSTLYNRMLELSGKRLFLDKTPRYYHIIPELYSIFPEANFIFLLRNPIAVLSSVLNTWFGNRVNEVKVPNLVDLIKGPVCLLDGIKLLKEKAIVVDYESLTRSPETVMHRVCNRIGIPYYQDLLNYGQNPKPEGRFGDSVGVYQHSRPVADNIDKWLKNILSPEHVEFADQYLRTLGSEIVSKMGYKYEELKQKLDSQKRLWHKPLTDAERERNLNKEGESFFANGDIDAALNSLQKAYYLDPNDAETNNNLAVIYYYKGKKEIALDHYQKATELVPENINFQKNLAEFYYVESGYVEKALNIYNKILTTNPKDIETLSALAIICRDLKKYEDAREFYERILALDSSNQSALYGLENLKNRNSQSTSSSLSHYENFKARSSEKDYLVSAIVSCYNSEEFIRGRLEDLESQTLAEKLEIIIIDSGSEQNERAIVEELKEKYSNIKYIRTENRETIYAAWNRGIKAASGKYMVNANTDDRLRKNALEIMSRVLEENDSVGAVYIDQIRTNYQNETFESHHTNGFLKRCDATKEILVQKNPCGPQVMWRRDLHDEIGYFRSDYEVAGDWDFWLRVAFQTNYEIRHIPELLGLYYYNLQGLEVGGRKQRERLQEIEEIKETYGKLYYTFQTKAKRRGDSRPYKVEDFPAERTANDKEEAISRDTKKSLNILLTTSAAPAQTPFSTAEKRAPIGIGFLISVLREAGHTVFFIDNYLKPSDFLETNYLQANDIQFVGIYANTICFRDTLRMIYKLEWFRQTGRWSGKILVGGPHTTVSLHTIPDFVDYVVQGEGELAIVDIVAGKVKERVVKYPRIKDLDELPMPAWDYFVNMPYEWGGEFFPEQPVFSMNTSRGCPFSCQFCSVKSIWGKRYTHFSAERIIDDIEYLMKTYGAKGIYFREDNFTLNRKRLKKFCNLILKRGIKISWACETRVNTLDQGTVELMAKAGACGFYFGVESGSQKMLDLLKKGIKVEETRKAFRLCHQYGIKTAASIVVGVPNETEADLKKTVALVEEIKPTITWFNVFVGIPNSDLYAYTLENKLYEFIDDRGLVYLKGHDQRVKAFYRGRWDAGIPFYSSARPKISVIMSVFNGEAYVASAIKSILCQTFPNFEFIIIDDASTDRTPEILAKFDDPRIRFITNAKNLGLTNCLNQGLSASKGEFVARMDADDISLPHRFVTQIAFLEKNPGHALVGSAFYLIDESGKIQHLVNRLTEDTQIRRALKNQNQFGHGSVMIRRSVLFELDGYETKFKYAQDYDLWLRISEKYKLANINEPLYCWRSTRACISNAKHKEQNNFANLAIIEARKRSSHAIMNNHLSHDERAAADATPAAQTDPISSNSKIECPATERASGFSFCVISAGKRPEKLARLIKSIHKQNIPAYEIIVAGVAQPRADIVQVAMPEAAQSGKIATLRNAAAERSRYDHLVFVDDDVVFLDGWYAELAPHVEKYDLLSTRFLNLDGTRFWDWSTIGGPKGHVMLDYDEWDPYIYLTGGLLVTSAKVWETIRWDDRRGINQFEDVDFSKRAREAGFKFFCCRASVAVHDDPRYTQIGRRIYVRKDTGVQIWLNNELANYGASELLDRAVKNLKEGLIAEAADCIRYCLWLETNNEVFLNAWQSFVTQIDFPTEDAESWQPHPILDNKSKLSDPSGTACGADPTLTSLLTRIGDAGTESEVNVPNTPDESFFMEFAPAILWHAPIFDPSGYADEARNFILQMQKQNIKPAVREIGRRSETFRNRLGEKERRVLDEAIAQGMPQNFISIVQFPAYAFKRLPGARYHIGRTTFETDGLPADWVRKCNLMDEIWVPSEFNMRTFESAGVSSRLFKVPEGVDTGRFRPGLDRLAVPGTRGVVFLSIFEWNYRKGWDILLKSWATTFSADDDVSLILRTYPMNVTDDAIAKREIEWRIDSFLQEVLQKSREEMAPIIVLTNQLCENDMPRLYAAANAYVLPSRGEGWGRTQMEAMASGLPVLSTRWSGNLEFMNDHNSLLIDIEGLVDIDERAEIPFYRGQKWAEPSFEHLSALMRKVVANPTGVRKIGWRARLDIERYWGWEKIAGIVSKRLRVIESDLNAPMVKTETSNNINRIRWEGSQFVNHSLALVNRELCLELAKRQGIELSIIPYEQHEFGSEADPKRFAAIEDRLQKALPGPADVHVRHQWPPNFTPPPDGHWIMIQPWEFGALPKSWVEPMENLVDELWVPSKHVRDVYIKSGIAPEKVFVVPNGVNHDQFNPRAAKLKLDTNKRFKFLFVGGTIMRKGIDVLLSAYTEAFTAADDVCMVIKDMGGDSFYKGQNAAKIIEDIKSNPESPEILYLTETLNAVEMAGLYTACDCLVHPYRGEGFGLPVAEAMACGLPVIVTRGGACDDFCSDETAYLIDSKVRPLQLEGCVLSAQGWLLEPDRAQLIDRLRFVYEHPGQVKEKGAIAARQIKKKVDWKMSTDLIVKRLSVLKSKPIRRFAGSSDCQSPQASKTPQKIYQTIQQSMQSKQPEDVIAELETLTEAYPEFALAHNDLGVLYYTAGNKEKAHQFYEKAVELDPDNMVFQKNLADFYFVELGKAKDALRIYIKVLETHPDDVETLLIAGHICVALHKFKDAGFFYWRVLEHEPSNAAAKNNLDKLDKMKPNAPEPKSPQEMYQEIQPLLNNGDPDKAIGALEELLQSYPDTALVHNDLGVLYYHTGDKDKARDHYEQATRLMPENINFQKNLADFYYVELDRIEDSLKIYVGILKTDPRDVEALLATGQICKALKKTDDARDFFKRVLEIEPRNADARKHIEEIERQPSGVGFNSESTDEAYRRLQQELNTLSPAAAIVELEKLLELHPNFAIGHNDLGVLYYKTGNKEKALHHYQQAALLQPENMTLQKNLADFLFVVKGRVEEALEIYMRILALDPHDLETLLITGHICLALKKFDDAEKFYEKVLALEPDNEDARNNLQALMMNRQKWSLANPDSTNGMSISGAKIEPADEDIEKPEKRQEEPKTIVSIVISLDGIQNRVKECLKSIQMHTPEPHELLFVDRGAARGMLKWARQLAKDNDHYHIIECARKAGWAESINQAIQKASGDIIVLAHNDVVFPEGWLNAFKMCIKLEPNIGLVGPMSNQAAGSQQLKHSDEFDRMEFESAAKAFSEQSQYRRVGVLKLSDFCFAFRRELADKIGYFDEQFFSEATGVEDFCYRAVSGGYQNLIAADQFVYHYDRHPVEKNASMHHSVSSEDRKKLKEKWNGTRSPESKAFQRALFMESANELSHKGQINQAIEVLLNAIGIQPGEQRFYLELAKILLAAKRFQDAKDALMEMPATADGQEMRKAELLAYAEEGLENFSAARAHIDRVLAMHPDRAPALNLKGILSYRNDDRQSAEKYFKRAIASDPGYGEPYTNLGMLALEAGRPQDALGLFEKAFRLTPANMDIATNYHSLVAEIGDYSKAEHLAREAAALYPDNQKLKYTLIDFLIQQGKYEAAMPEIEDAIIKFGFDDGILDASLKLREKLGPMTIKKPSKKTQVSLCMIIKDEEKYLARCLASVKPIVDEMIVVDTGSADRSKDIAVTFGAQVYDYDWENDFAAARNFSISKASGEWILILDGDEVISPLDYAQFNKIVAKEPKTPVAYSITTRNYNRLANIVGWVPNDGRYSDEEAAIGWLPSEKVRLFYGKDQIWFEGAVHELVDPVLKRSGIKIKKCSIPVHHYGRLDKEKLNRKGEIYFDMGQKKLAEMGEDMNALRELAIQATILEKNQKALELWQKLLVLNPNSKLAAIAYVNMGTIYNRQKKFENALEAGKKAVANDPDLKEARYNLALAELHCGNAENTIRILENLLCDFPEYPPAQFILAAACCCKGQKEKGLDGIRKLKNTSMGAHLEVPCVELAQSLQAAKKTEYALRVLGAAIDCDVVNKEILDLFSTCIKMNGQAQKFSEIQSTGIAEGKSIKFENLLQ